MYLQFVLMILLIMLKLGVWVTFCISGLSYLAPVVPRLYGTLSKSNLNFSVYLILHL